MEEQKSPEVIQALPNGTREIILPSGAKATIEPFKGKHVRVAQLMADKDTSKYMYAIIAQIVKIDGQGITMEDLDDMPGADTLSLMGEFGEGFTSPGK